MRKMLLFKVFFFSLSFFRRSVFVPSTDLRKSLSFNPVACLSMGFKCTRSKWFEPNDSSQISKALTACFVFRLVSNKWWRFHCLAIFIHFWPGRLWFPCRIQIGIHHIHHGNGCYKATAVIKMTSISWIATYFHLYKGWHRVMVLFFCLATRPVSTAVSLMNASYPFEMSVYTAESCMKRWNISEKCCEPTQKCRTGQFLSEFHSKNISNILLFLNVKKEKRTKEHNRRSKNSIGTFKQSNSLNFIHSKMLSNVEFRRLMRLARRECLTFLNISVNSFNKLLHFSTSR